ncbi:MAG: hypothetical protein AAB074_10955 [Planctomycetota bacterium]
MLVSPVILKELERFVWHKLWTDSNKPHGDENRAAKESLGGGALPLLVLFDGAGREISRLPDADKADVLITESQLLEALRKIR